MAAHPIQQQPTPGHAWRPVDLTTHLAGAIVTPRPEFGRIEGGELGLFYPGRVSAVFGPSGAGKSWITTWLIAEVIAQGGDAVLVDFEDQPATVISRLRLLGSSDDLIASHLLYIQPQERWSTAAHRTLTTALEERRPVLAVLDSVGESMAVDGINPNGDDEVARWFRQAARVLASTGAATVLIDHTGRESNAANKQSPVGSHRKRASLSGALYRVDVLVPWSRDRAGHLRMVVRKDRFGWRGADTTACDIHLRNGDDGRVHLTAIAPPVVEQVTHEDVMEAVSLWLETQQEPVSHSRIRQADVLVRGYQCGRNEIDAALDALVADGYVERPTTTRGRASQIRSLKAYLQPPTEKVVF